MSLKYEPSSEPIGLHPARGVFRAGHRRREAADLHPGGARAHVQQPVPQLPPRGRRDADNVRPGTPPGHARAPHGRIPNPHP